MVRWVYRGHGCISQLTESPGHRRRGWGGLITEGRGSHSRLGNTHCGQEGENARPRGLPQAINKQNASSHQAFRTKQRRTHQLPETRTSPPHWHQEAHSMPGKGRVSQGPCLSLSHTRVQISAPSANLQHPAHSGTKADIQRASYPAAV